VVQASELRLIVGLGNPGTRYELTRHNIGFLVVRSLAEMFRGEFSLSSFKNAAIATIKEDSKEILLLMPMTYMNRSGIAVEQVVSQYQIQPENLLVVCDDFNLDFGQIRLRSKGSDGGHNGLGSIIERLTREEFPRLRLGVGIPPMGDDVVDYVLGEFLKAEQAQLGEFVGKATECCRIWLNEGIRKAMDTYNRRMENGKD
jgi:peptidyl-tRNA hydrolase, PTH1 family